MTAGSLGPLSRVSCRSRSPSWPPSRPCGAPGSSPGRPPAQDTTSFCPTCPQVPHWVSRTRARFPRATRPRSPTHVLGPLLLHPRRGGAGGRGGRVRREARAQSPGTLHLDSGGRKRAGKGRLVSSDSGRCPLSLVPSAGTGSGLGAEQRGSVEQLRGQRWAVSTQQRPRTWARDHGTQGRRWVSREDGGPGRGGAAVR